MSNNLKILSRPKGNAEEYGRWSCNPYIGCGHGCLYCYLKKGPSGAYLGQNEPMLKKGVVDDRHAYHLAMAEIAANRDDITRDGGLFITFTSDPLQPETRNLSLTIASDAMDMGIPVVLLTKDATFLDLDLDIDPLYEKITGLGKEEEWRRCIPYFHAGIGRLSFIDNPHFVSRSGAIAFGFTLTGHDELEPAASPNADRISAMKRLAERGYKVWASIEPVIDFDTSYQMIADALAAGCRHFKIGLLTDRTRVVRRPFGFGGHQFKAYDLAECCQFVGYVMELTDGRATVYWKQSFVDFLQGPDRKSPQPVHGMTAREFLHQWEHSVDKNWNMFNNGVCLIKRIDV